VAHGGIRGKGEESPEGLQCWENIATIRRFRPLSHLFQIIIMKVMKYGKRS
jgi:hypothetical protein